MKNVVLMTSDERKAEFVKFLKEYIETKNEKSTSYKSYIRDLDKGFEEAPVNNYSSIYDITDPCVLEDPIATKGLRESSVFRRQSSGGTAALAGLNKYIRFLKDSRDSYYGFMEYFRLKPDDIFQWGIEAIIYPPDEMVEYEWKNLKHRIFNDEKVYIRGYGRDAKGTHLFIGLYKHIFNNSHVVKDSTNNSRPQSNIARMTGLKRNKDIYNYQVSHIWGRTKNIFLFEAPWNICLTPKIIDPFTGHETKGDLPDDFKEYFLEFAQKKYKKYIDDYNSIIESFDINLLLNQYCEFNGIADEKFVKDAIEELKPIEYIKK